MNKESQEYDIIRKKACLQYLYIVVITLSIFTAFYIKEDVNPLKKLFIVYAIMHIPLIVIAHKFNYESLKHFIPIYIVYLSFFLYVNVLFYWLFGQITAFIWLCIIPVAAMVFFQRKAIIFWSIYVLVLICSAFIVDLFIPEGYYRRPSEELLTLVNVITIFMNIGFIMFFLYYLSQINLIKELQLNKYEIKDEQIIKDTDNTKFDNLYDNILNYFSVEKPYCNPNFTIAQLAEDIDSNVKYISRVIKIKEEVNFNVFLNQYRIKLVKELIAMNYHNKYTIRHIYTSAGFKYQATFNKVFKDIEGITPSEYIKRNKINS